MGKDIAVNIYSGQLATPELVIDVTLPTGSIVTVPTGPVQTLNPASIVVQLTLSEQPKQDVSPVLSFTSPVGVVAPVVLSGSGTNWNGTLDLTPDMGSGFGKFALTVLDGVGNVGSNITAGVKLELYNTAFPTPPSAPVNLQAATRKDGKVLVAWNSVSNAEIYRLYRDNGNSHVVATNLVLDNIVTNIVEDLPPADGSYHYTVTAARRGAESPAANSVVVASDRTPPPAPTDVAAVLAVSGVQITWKAPAGNDVPDHYNVYRNDTLLQQVKIPAAVFDSPPRGVMTYRIASADYLNNENFALGDNSRAFCGGGQQSRRFSESRPDSCFYLDIRGFNCDWL